MINYLKHVWFIITSGLAGLAGVFILLILSGVFGVLLGGALFVFSMGHGLASIWKALSVQHDIYVKMKGKK